MQDFWSYNGEMVANLEHLISACSQEERQSTFDLMETATEELERWERMSRSEITPKDRKIGARKMRQLDEKMNMILGESDLGDEWKQRVNHIVKRASRTINMKETEKSLTPDPMQHFRSFAAEMMLILERLISTKSRKVRHSTLVTMQMETEELKRWERSTEITPKQRDLGSLLLRQLDEKMNVILDESQLGDEWVQRVNFILQRAASTINVTASFWSDHSDDDDKKSNEVEHRRQSIVSMLEQNKKKLEVMREEIKKEIDEIAPIQLQSNPNSITAKKRELQESQQEAFDSLEKVKRRKAEMKELVDMLREEVDRLMAAFGAETPDARKDSTWIERVELKRTSWIHADAIGRINNLVEVSGKTEHRPSDVDLTKIKWIINDVVTVQKQVISLLDTKDDYVDSVVKARERGKVLMSGLKKQIPTFKPIEFQELEASEPSEIQQKAKLSERSWTASIFRIVLWTQLVILAGAFAWMYFIQFSQYLIELTNHIDESETIESDTFGSMLSNLFSNLSVGVICGFTTFGMTRRWLSS